MHFCIIFMNILNNSRNIKHNKRKKAPPLRSSHVAGSKKNNKSKKTKARYSFLTRNITLALRSLYS